MAVYQEEWVKVPPRSEETDSPLLLKLHGSTNWLTSAPVVEGKEWQSIQELSNDHFFIYQGTKTPYPTYDGTLYGWL